MADVSIKVDEAELKNVYKALKDSPKAANRALIRTLNDTAQRTLTPLKKNITDNYAMKKKDLSGGSNYKGENSNNLIKVKKINSLTQTAGISVRGGHLTLMRFVKGNKTPTNKKGKNVTVQVRKGKSFKMSRYNFLQYGNGGTVQLFQRHSKSRNISRVLKTVSVAHMASNTEVARKTQQSSNEILQKRAKHYIEFELNKLKGGSK